MPVDGKSNLLLRYRGEEANVPVLSAADVLSGAVPPEALRGKIVFVGTTALGTREVVATPLDTLFAGVEVQATVADNLLQQDSSGDPASGRPWKASRARPGHRAWRAGRTTAVSTAGSAAAQS